VLLVALLVAFLCPPLVPLALLVVKLLAQLGRLY
jgi:hypothetical protein